MIKKKLWIMENLTFDNFQRYRLERYRACDIKIQGNDSVMVKYYTYLIIHFFRKRKISKEDPFSTQKFIHTAISLYKRYYLVNIYTEGFLLQNALCCIYLSLKMNQIPQEQIAKYSAAWKSKNEAFLSQQCVHFKEPGYNQKQLTLLRGIGFQIGRSPLIPAIQSLYHELKQSIQNAELLKQILDFMLEMLRRIYLDEKAIFLFEGPKLGLAIVLHTLQQKQKQSKLSLSIQNLLGTQIWSLIQREKIEVLGIVDYIAKIAKLEQKVISAEAKQLKDKIIKCKKKTFEVPQKKSPKISPVNYELFDEKRLQN